MRAIVIERPGGPDVLALREVPTPEPGPSDIRVRVAATAVNRADLVQRLGRYPAPPGWPADIPGLEFAGTVDAVGGRVTLWRPGDRVMGLVGGGGYAEAVVVHEREAVRVPDRLPLQEAAAVPEVFITAHDALFTRLGLGPGEWLLVHAVGSGVGTAAVQLALTAGARVIGTARSAWKLERAAGLGLELGIDSTAADFVEAVLGATRSGTPAPSAGDTGTAGARAVGAHAAVTEPAGPGAPAATGEAGVHAVLDLVGGDVFSRSLRVLRTRGRIALVGLVAGARAEVDLGLLLRRRIAVVGTSLRTRPLEEKIAATRAFERHVVPLLETGRVRPVIDRVLPAAQAAEAHRVLEADEAFGKVVLSWEG